MKVYIAYEGDLDRHDRQYYDIIGVYTNEADAYNAVQQTIIESDMEIKVETRGSTTWWVEYGVYIVNVGKVEEHILIKP